MKDLNPSLQIYIQNRAELLKDTIKPVQRVEDFTVLCGGDNSPITGDVIELWKCSVKSRSKVQFVYEYTDYPYRVLTDISALKLYGYIKHHKLTFHNDEFRITAEEVIEYCAIKRTAYYTALQSLLKHNIIFKTTHKGVYYINVMMFFKGDINKLINKRINIEKYL